MYDHVNKFIGHSFKNDLIKKRIRYKSKFATTDNPQSNSILEIVHQGIVNLVRMFDL